jgi:transglutaminase/protease-like cytokinesis protein 3
MTRPPVLLAASTALAALALAGCGGSASSSSGTVGGTASASLPSSPDVSASASSLASGASSAASSAADQLTAVKDCLQKANLPTPTSTDATGLLQELPKLVQDPKVQQALKDCNINIPGMG